MADGRRSGSCLGAAVLLAVLMVGCGSSGGYINPDVNFGYLKRAAVLPFDNLASDDLADERIHSIFLMEVLKADVLEIVGPGETAAAVRSLGIRPASFTPNQAMALGDRLKVDAFFFGTVEEYGIERSGRGSGPQVTATFGLAETETGSVIWRSQVHQTGSSFWNKLFGGGAGQYKVSVKAVRKALGTLL